MTRVHGAIKARVARELFDEARLKGDQAAMKEIAEEALSRVQWWAAIVSDFREACPAAANYLLPRPIELEGLSPADLLSLAEATRAPATYRRLRLAGAESAE